ncbi:MAG: cobyrinate a,c-diamide synthase [Geminicoccaceae bacterium]
MRTPAILIAAPASGSGKTTTTLAVLRALRRRGLRVGSFKVGPDYIDPEFHARATGRPCHNLDSWAMRFGTLAALLDAAGRDADIVVGEGVMGLFDGAPDGSGSTADIAALLGLPVVLVLDVRAMGASVAALADGFVRFREDVDVTALILNRVGSEAHDRALREALDARLSTPVLGAFPQLGGLALPSRHLGLVLAQEHGDLEAFLDGAAAAAEGALDLDRLVRLARPPSVATLHAEAVPVPPPGQRIALARDAAFAFAYAATLQGWRRRGAELVPFSPLADEAPDAAADAVVLPGGYPELHAGRLAGSGRFLAGLRAAAARGAFVYGECGGYMVLGEALVDAQSLRHPMAGLLPVVTSFAERRRHLGYRRIELLDGCPLGEAGTGFRGHEFHYACEIANHGVPFLRAADVRGHELGPVGCRAGSVAGSFLHLIDRT